PCRACDRPPLPFLTRLSSYRPRPPARRARQCRVRYHFFGLAVVTRLVEDTAGLGPFASLFRGLEFPAEYSSDLLFTLCSNQAPGDRKSTRLNSSHQIISYADF